MTLDALHAFAVPGGLGEGALAREYGGTETKAQSPGRPSRRAATIRLSSSLGSGTRKYRLFFIARACVDPVYSRAWTLRSAGKTSARWTKGLQPRAEEPPPICQAPSSRRQKSSFPLSAVGWHAYGQWTRRLCNPEVIRRMRRFRPALAVIGSRRASERGIDSSGESGILAG